MAAKVTSSSDLTRAFIILPIIDKYMLIVLYICGIISSSLNIATLLQKKFRRNSCSVYFLCTSMTDFTIMNCVLITDALRYLNPSLFIYMNTNLFWCKLGKYLVFLLPCLSSTFITLASIDRFCTSSNQVQLRKLSQLKVSRIVIPTAISIWILFSLHIIILYDIMLPLPSSQAERCRGPSHLLLFLLIVDGYFFSLFNGAIVPLLLCIFGLLIYRNVRMSRQRITPGSDRGSNRSETGVRAGNSPLNRQNLHLITMVLVQSSLTIFLNIPYMTIYLSNLHNKIPTQNLLLLVYLIFAYIARWFWFLNYVKTFYLNSLSSQIFRSTFKQQFNDLNRNLITRLRQRLGL